MTSHRRSATSADPTIPYLTFVIASRNDSYAGGMLPRLQVCIDSILHQAETFRIPLELIVVDWNPPAGKPLAPALRWPDSRRWSSIRVITVPPSVHATLPFAGRLPILIHRARNVGVRRARGAFILPTSPDILLSDELAEEISRQELDPAAMYRIARHDVPIDALGIAGHEERLQYCREHVTQVHERGTGYRLPNAPSLFTTAAGDFTMLSREMYWKLRGIPEEREFHSMHFDGLFCFMAHAAGAKEVVFAEPSRIYHVDHGTASWRQQASMLERLVRRLPLNDDRMTRAVAYVHRVAPPQSDMDRRKVAYLEKSTPEGKARFKGLLSTILAGNGTFFYNDMSWGLGNEQLHEHVW